MEESRKKFPPWWLPSHCVPKPAFVELAKSDTPCYMALHPLKMLHSGSDINLFSLHFASQPPRLNHETQIHVDVEDDSITIASSCTTPSGAENQVYVSEETKSAKENEYILFKDGAGNWVLGPVRKHFKNIGVKRSRSDEENKMVSSLGCGQHGCDSSLLSVSGPESVSETCAFDGIQLTNEETYSFEADGAGVGLSDSDSND